MFVALTNPAFAFLRAAATALTRSGLAARHAFVIAACFSRLALAHEADFAFTISRFFARYARLLARTFSGLAFCQVVACRWAQTTHPSLMRRSAICPCLQGRPVKY